MKYETEADLIDALRTLHSADQRQAAADAEAAPARLRRTRIRSTSDLGVGLAVLGVCVIAIGLIAPGLLRTPGPAAGATGASAVDATVNQSSAPSISTTVGPSLVVVAPTSSVFPASLDGQPVLEGQAAAQRISSTISDPVLIAGWVRIVTVDCFSDCGTSVMFFLSQPSLGNGAVTSALAPVRLAGPATEVLQLPTGVPVVLKVHSDPTCSASSPTCPALWLDGIAWHG